jgi:hypothetical protein
MPLQMMKAIDSLFRQPCLTVVLAGAALLPCGHLAYGADAPPDADNAQNERAQANNPLAHFTAFNVHDYYIGELTDSDEDANQLWFRYAQPFALGDTLWLMRASLPFNTYPAGEDAGQQSGLGDLNVFAAWLIDTGVKNMSFGFGPQATLPTATETALGSEQWSAGLVNTMFYYGWKKLQVGYLLSWQASFAGDEDRADVNLGAYQPFLFYQLGEGWYLRSTAVMTCNFDNDTYSVPIGLGLGKVLPGPKRVFNIFVEPQVSVAERGSSWPEWQVFIGLNTQFK